MANARYDTVANTTAARAAGEPPKQGYTQNATSRTTISSTVKVTVSTDPMTPYPTP